MRRWYSVGEPNGGTFREYATLFTALVPAPRRAGCTDTDIDQLVAKNPQRAFTVQVRRATAAGRPSRGF